VTSGAECRAETAKRPWAFDADAGVLAFAVPTLRAVRSLGGDPVRMAAAKIACPSCGAKNDAGSTRCVSCGSKIEATSGGKTQRTREEELERRYQQEGMSVQWLFIAFAVQTVLTAALVFGLPMVVTALDFEGGNGMTVCVPVWFLGGLLVGMISPGRTFIEPVVASFIVAIPTTFFLVQSQTVRMMPPFLYVIMAAIGVLFTLIGAYIGERIQLGPPPKPTE
jgi:DNA-directed RNA polymerase subunit RPC12/RpoP